MERPRRSRPASAEPVAIFPEQLRIGDRCTNADGEWQVVSRPVTFKQGHEVRARIQRPGDPGSAFPRSPVATSNAKVPLARTLPRDVPNDRKYLISLP